MKRPESYEPFAPDPIPDDRKISHEMRAGDSVLRGAFLEEQHRAGPARSRIVEIGNRAAPVILIEAGLAYRAAALPDGRRPILDLLLPGDIAGIEHVMFGQPTKEVWAATEISYRAMAAAQLRRLMTNPAVSLRIAAILAEARWRVDRHTAIRWLDARERIATFLLDLYSQMRRRNLISDPSFRLPLTKLEIAAHLGISREHASRIFRDLRESGLIVFERQVVRLDVDGLRRIVSGLAPLPELPQGFCFEQGQPDSAAETLPGCPPYRDRARRIRGLAESANDPTLRDQLNKVAVDYEQLAETEDRINAATRLVDG